jgi:hypothetical protein
VQFQGIPYVSALLAYVRDTVTVRYDLRDTTPAESSVKTGLSAEPWALDHEDCDVTGHSGLTVNVQSTGVAVAQELPCAFSLRLSASADGRVTRANVYAVLPAVLSWFPRSTECVVEH